MKQSSEGESRGYWRGVWKHYRKRRSGLVGLGVFALLLLVAFFSNLLAGGLPIACRYKGDVTFPAIVATVHKIPGGEHLWSMPKPFGLPSYGLITRYPSKHSYFTRGAPGMGR